jgi:hypothetical protein
LTKREKLGIQISKNLQLPKTPIWQWVLGTQMEQTTLFPLRAEPASPLGHVKGEVFDNVLANLDIFS